MDKKSNGGTSMVTLDAIRTAASVLMRRMGWANHLGMRFDGKRDYYNVFGYKVKLAYKDFVLKYERQDIASRIIDAPVVALWSNPPQFEHVDVQKTWDQLNRKHKLLPTIARADKMCRLGEFSLLMIGARGSPSTPLPKDSDLLYLRPIAMDQVTDIELETNTASERYGLPLLYKIKKQTDRRLTLSDGSTLSAETATTTDSMTVHHSRIIHIAENALDTELFGTPAMARVFNLLDDLTKVAGGTAETYWLAANRGMQVDIDKEMDLAPDDAKALSDEIDDYIHGLRRFVRTRGVEMKNLGSDVPTPQQSFEMLIGLVSGTTGIPKRILMGSEAGQLASEQDRANWAERTGERRLLFADPRILTPLLDAFYHMGLIKEEAPAYEWPSAFIMSPLESSMVMAQTARAIGNISRQTGNKKPMQLTSRAEGRALLGLKGDLKSGDLMEQPEESSRNDNTDIPSSEGPEDESASA